MLNLMPGRNISKVAIYYIHENPKLLFSFSISCYFIFFPNECSGLCQHRPGHSLGENKVAQNEKMKLCTWVFIFQKYGNFFLFHQA